MEVLQVLVTDDEMGMRLGVARTLRDFIVHVPDVNVDVTFAIDEAGSGEEALEKIQKSPPDILLLDHKMPGISGLEVLDRLSDLKCNILTIMITAYASIETAVTATKRGAYDFLAKPFTPDELKSTIRKTATRLVLARQARKLTEEKRLVRFEFIRVLGHELKSPLNAIAGYLNLIQKHYLGNDLASYDEMLGRCLIRIDGMHKLIHDLLNLTQIESGEKSRQLGPVDVAAVARTAVESVQADADAKNIAIHLHADAAIPMTADAGELNMLFNNLLSNAIKYNRDGGSVDVSITPQDSLIKIVVADTGIGMTPEEQEQIFGEFVRIKNEKTNQIEGSGLGLSIVKKLTQLYDGDVQVESQPDIGTTFTITLASGQTANPD